MLRPAQCITNCGRFFRTGCSNQRVCNFMKKRRRNAANFLHHLRRVTTEVAAQRLENAPRMLQGQIALRETKATITIVGPGVPVVSAYLPTPAGEHASLVFFRVAKIIPQYA